MLRRALGGSKTADAGSVHLPKGNPGSEQSGDATGVRVEGSGPFQHLRKTSGWSQKSQARFLISRWSNLLRTPLRLQLRQGQSSRCEALLVRGGNRSSAEVTGQGQRLEPSFPNLQCNPFPNAPHLAFPARLASPGDPERGNGHPACSGHGNRGEEGVTVTKGLHIIRCLRRPGDSLRLGVWGISNTSPLS